MLMTDDNRVLDVKELTMHYMTRKGPVYAVDDVTFHVSRGDVSVIGMNILFAVLSLFVYWGRTKKVPILGKASMLPQK